ncbi:hypothetical protein F5X96DRAFT_665718 [Biscogniauxia mediterranea]|nr:hypothetical protein F5X96DRAFT_665718 [Biscogniauxia mediterranea]
MRFILVVGATLLSMVAALPPQGESMPLLQPRCLASGVASVQRITDVAVTHVANRGKK